jgi:hypothetical protein
LQKNLGRIKAVLGKDYKLEVNFGEIVSKVKRDAEDTAKFGNDMYDRYMNAFACL